MSSGFYDNNVDVGDVYVTRDWLISRYPNLADSLLVNIQKRVGFAGSGYSGKSPFTLTTNDQLAPANILNENAAQGNWVDFARNGTLGIKQDGSLWAWGTNTVGQVGDGTTTSRSSPVLVGYGYTWKNIAASGNRVAGTDVVGNLYTWGSTNGVRGWSLISSSGDGSLGVSAGLDVNGYLYTWGGNTRGQLGQNDRVHRSSPTQLGTNRWSTVSVAGSYTVAVRSDGTLWAWGLNSDGHLGVNDRNHRSSPTQIGTDSNWAAVAAGASCAFALRTNGTLWAWGPNGLGQLGLNDTVHRSSPVQVGTSSWSQIAAGDIHGAALRIDGGLFTWGWNQYYGYLGQNDEVARSTPTQVGTSSWSQVAAGYLTTAALRSDGTAWAWGYNSFGALGLGDANSRSAPTQIGSSSWSQISINYAKLLLRSASGNVYGAGTNGYLELIQQFTPSSSWAMVSTYHWSSFAIKNDGTLWAWGANGGVLGLNDTASRSSPVQIGTSSWTHVHAAESTVVAVRSDGTVWSWGQQRTMSSPPVYPVPDSFVSSPVQIGSGVAVTAAKAFTTQGNGILVLATDGKLYAYGHTFYDNAMDAGSILGTPLPDNAYSWTQIKSDATDYSMNTIGIRSDGSLWTWGRNYDGSLGTTSFANGVTPYSPVQVGTSSWTTATAGNDRHAAIRSDGALFAWGNNNNGQLGQSDLTHRSSPVQIGTSSWSQVAYGPSHCVAIRSDGRLFVWGMNTNGQLGLNDRAHRSSPVQIDASSSWSQIALDENTTFAIRNDGALFTWGINNVGQLGQNDLIHRSSPVQVGTSSWSQVAVGTSLGLAIRSDGRLFTWGINTDGQQGLNDRVHRSSPVQVDATSSWIYVATRLGAVAAIKNDNKLFTWGDSYTDTVGVFDTIPPSPRSSPVQLDSSNWSSVYIGRQKDFENYNSGPFFYGIKTNNTAWFWGRTSASYYTYGGYSQVNEVSGISQPRVVTSPTQVGGTFTVPWLSSFTQIGTALWSDISVRNVNRNYVTVGGVKTNGTLWMWGTNGRGQHGQNDTIQRSSMVQLGSATNWSKITVGAERNSNTAGIYESTRDLLYVHALKTNGELWSWGSGTIGDSSLYISRSSPVQLQGSWTAIGPGRAIKYDGTLWAWGIQYSGPNNATPANWTETYSSPVQIGTDTNWASVTTGFKHYGIQFSAGYDSDASTTLGLKTNGQLWGYGDNTNWELGRITPVDLSFPVQIDAYPITYFSSPVQVNAGTSWSNVFNNPNGSIFLSTAGGLSYFKGYNTGGGGGDGTQVHRSSPVLITPGGTSLLPSLVTGTNKYITTDITDSNAFAIKDDGTLWGWGTNSNGELGNNTTAAVSVIAQLGTSSWSAVSAGSDHVMAIRADGTLWTWGLNDVGQLGQSDVISRSSPVQIGTASNWRSICAGSKISGALTTDNKMYVWGRNNFGQVGDGTSAHRSSPVQIGANVWTKFIAFNRNDIQSSYAIDTGGSLFAWGEDTNNSLGVTSTAHRSSPVQVATAGYAVLDITSANNSGVGVYVFTDGGNLG